MRKATFSSHRFQIKFGITEENEDEIDAAHKEAEPDLPQPETTINITAPAAAPEDLTKLALEPPQEWQDISVISKSTIAKLPGIGNASSPNGNAMPVRRQTMPEISTDQLSRLSSNSLLSRPIESINNRRPSITNVAICSSIGPSLAGIFPGAPSNLFIGTADDSSAASQLLSNLRRSATFSDLNGPLDLEAAATDARGRRWSSKLPFWRGLQHQDSKDSTTTENSEVQLVDQHRPKHHHHHYFHHHHHHHVLPHLHVPTFSITGPTSEGSGTGRKFSFGIRRHSHTVGPGFVARFSLPFVNSVTDGASSI